jgi:hypothetical protein
MSLNGAIFNPEDNSLVISAKPGDIRFFGESDGRITIAVANVKDGIEIVHSEDRLWWPV